MEKDAKMSDLAQNYKKKVKKSHKFRDTVLVRVDRVLKESAMAESKRVMEPLSKIMDWAVTDYLKSVSRKD